MLIVENDIADTLGGLPCKAEGIRFKKVTVYGPGDNLSLIFVQRFHLMLGHYNR